MRKSHKVRQKEEIIGVLKVSINIWHLIKRSFRTEKMGVMGENNGKAIISKTIFLRI